MPTSCQSLIDSIEPVAEENTLRNGQAQGRVVDLQILVVRRQTHGVRIGVGLSVGDHRRNDHGRRHSISVPLKCRRIEPGDSLGRRKPQSSIRPFHQRWRRASLLPRGPEAHPIRSAVLRKQQFGSLSQACNFRCGNVRDSRESIDPKIVRFEFPQCQTLCPADPGSSIASGRTGHA